MTKSCKVHVLPAIYLFYDKTALTIFHLLSIRHVQYCIYHVNMLRLKHISFTFIPSSTADINSFIWPELESDSKKERQIIITIIAEIQSKKNNEGGNAALIAMEGATIYCHHWPHWQQLWHHFHNRDSQVYQQCLLRYWMESRQQSAKTICKVKKLIWVSLLNKYITKYIRSCLLIQQLRNTFGNNHFPERVESDLQKSPRSISS